MPLLTAGPGHQIRKGGKQLFAFDLNVLDDSTRKVYGLATDPHLDRENETILKAAIEQALPNFMMLPIMHLDHTERPVGWFTKAEFRGQDLYVEACVKPTSDCDEFWADVVKASRSGRPYQFSIYGDRLDCTPSCALLPDDPRRQVEPCITKALELYSISICQPGTAINPNTFAEVMKAMSIERTNTQRPCRKATDSASSMIHPTTDGKYPKEVTKTMEPPQKKEEENPEAPKEPIKDADAGPEMRTEESGGDMKPVIDLLTQVVQRLQSLESSLGLYKSESYGGKETPEEEKKEKEEGDPVAKSPCAMKAAAAAAVPADTVTITKAELGRLQKAEAQILALTKELDTIKKRTATGPDVIVIDPEAVKKAATDDPTKAPVVKSAAAQQIENFHKLFR